MASTRTPANLSGRFALMVLLVVAGVPYAFSEPTPVARNLPYKADGFPLQHLDLYRPGGPGPFPIVLAIHGGGSNKDEFIAWGQYLAAKGIALASIDYRGQPGRRLDPKTSSYPASYEDSALALAWIRAEGPAYGLDTKRIAVLGFSLGGTLGAMLGCAAPGERFGPAAPVPPLAGVVAVSGEYDYAGIPMLPEVRQYMVAYLGATKEENPARWKEASPLYRVKGGEPPFLLIQGDSDEWIDIRQPQAFLKALTAAKVQARLVMQPGDHMAVIKSEKTMELVAAELAMFFAAAMKR